MDRRNGNRRGRTYVRRVSVASGPEGLSQNSAFDNAIWSKDNCTISANADGTADGLVENVDIAQGHGVYQTIALTGFTDASSATGSVKVKAGSRNWVRLAVFGQPVFAWFNVGTGALGTPLNCTNAITSAGSGYYTVSITWTISFAATPQFSIMATDSDWGGTTDGTGALALYLKEAHVTQP